MARVWVGILAATVFSWLVSAASIPRRSFHWDDTKYLIAFGDSYTFVEGTEGVPAFSFIGSYLPGEFGFTPAQLLRDKIVRNFTTGTAEGGPNWVEFLTGCGGLEADETLPSTCDRQLWDFAFAGADVSAAFLPPHHNDTVPLVNQTQQYLAWAEPVLGPGMDKARALVAVWIGINDIIDSADFRNVSFPAFYDKLITAVFEETVAPMYAAGYARFLLVNLPPLDRTAANVATDTPLPSREMVAWWNDALARHTAAFAASHPDATALLYDANTFLNRVLDHPARYGIRNTTAYCEAFENPDVQRHPAKYGCLSLDQYFWFNSAHMTSHTHELLATDMEKFLQEQSS